MLEMHAPANCRKRASSRAFMVCLSPAARRALMRARRFQTGVFMTAHLLHSAGKGVLVISRCRSSLAANVAAGEGGLGRSAVQDDRIPGVTEHAHWIVDHLLACRIKRHNV